MSVLIVILIISFLVIIHELGHFIAAKRAKVKVEEFGLGYPPKIFKLFCWQGTDFTLNLIPFGGFVRMAGEHGSEIDEKKKKSDSNKIGPFYSKSSKQRMIVILAGVVVNIVFAVFSFSVVYSFLGIPTEIDQPRIGWVSKNSPAQQAGLPENVNLVEIRSPQQSYQIDSVEQIQEVVKKHRGEELTAIATGVCDQLVCPTETKEYQIYARTEEETPPDQGSLGIIFTNSVLKFYPWYQMPFRGMIYGTKQAIAFAVLILRALVDVFTHLLTTGTVQEDVAGPVGIVYEAHQGNLIQKDFLSNLGFAGMLSLNLAIMNLLPIPALDGGRALFIFLEKIFDKKKIQKIEVYANYLGFALLMILIVAITIKDVIKVING
ncbi:MAG: M50 family metallopeptidase [Patescibacteria group bacterium]|nr:M50 family metallopeptidase [Patescibacteria group bacterium]